MKLLSSLQDLSMLNDTTLKVLKDVCNFPKLSYENEEKLNLEIEKYRNLVGISGEAYGIFKKNHPMLNYLYFDNTYLRWIIKPIVNVLMKLFVRNLTWNIKQ